MKKLLAALMLSLFTATGVSYGADVQDSVGALYRRNFSNDLSFTCTITAIANEGDYVVMLTAKHCINETQKHYLVTFNNTTFYNAELYKIPREHPDDPQDIDMALLRAKNVSQPLLPTGASEAVKIGSEVLTVGFPNGMAKLQFQGHLAGRVDNPSEKYHKYLLLQIFGSYGSSGTSVVSKADNKIVGVLVAMTTSGTPIFFVTPIEYMQYLVTPAEKRKVQRENK